MCVPVRRRGRSYCKLLLPGNSGTTPATPTCIHLFIHWFHQIHNGDLRIMQTHRGGQCVADGYCLMELFSLFVLYFKKFCAPLCAKNIPVRTFISCTKIVDRLLHDNHYERSFILSWGKFLICKTSQKLHLYI